MSEEIALFPLSSVVLFPRVRTPLHIFEPRYRQMTEHALAGDRHIGMVMVRTEYDAEMAGDPPVYPIGCAGIISEAQRLPDGRFLIVEEPPRAPDLLYRVARVERLADPYAAPERARVGELRERVLELVRRLLLRAARDQAQSFTPDLFRDM